MFVPKFYQLFLPIFYSFPKHEQSLRTFMQSLRTPVKLMLMKSRRWWKRNEDMGCGRILECVTSGNICFIFLFLYSNRNQTSFFKVSKYGDIYVLKYVKFGTRNSGDCRGTSLLLYSRMSPLWYLHELSSDDWIKGVFEIWFYSNCPDFLHVSPCKTCTKAHTGSDLRYSTWFLPLPRIYQEWIKGDKWRKGTTYSKGGLRS